MTSGQRTTIGQRAMIGQIVISAAARARADEIDTVLGQRTRRYEGPASEGLPAAWGECDLIISHLALGATVRILAPLLNSKKTDPGVVVIDEAGRFAVPIVGGHGGGANELARTLSAGMGATAVLTTATDALGLPALDTLGWVHRGDVAAVTRSLIDGRPVLLERTSPWPMPPLPGNVVAQVTPGQQPAARIVVTDELAEPYLAGDLPTVVLHPKSLVAGMGCNKGTESAQLTDLLAQTLAEAGLAIESLAAVTTVDLKSGELGLLKLVHHHGVPLVDYPAPELARQDVPNPSAVVDGHIGSPSVSEASVLAHGAELVVPKQRSQDATCAIGRTPARGRLSVVGLGPGARDLLSPRAVDTLQRSTYVVGYAPYVKQVRDLLRPGTEIFATKMGTEEERTAAAIARARAGEQVSLVCSGDPGVYAMASPVLEQGTEGIDVDIVPGITASLAVSAILGAALGHDHATISLSDLHTSWEVIEQRLTGAAQGDFVTALYNPRSKKRRMHLPRALEIMSAHRPAETPVAVVHQACRPGQSVHLSTLAEFDPDLVDMNSLVVIGSSRTRYVSSGGGELRMVTPRDYQWMAS